MTVSEMNKLSGVSVRTLKGLGEVYSGGGSMTENSDRAGGEGTAAFVTEAIRVYCQ